MFLIKLQFYWWQTESKLIVASGTDLNNADNTNDNCSIKINPVSENSEIIRTAAAIALLIILKKQWQHVQSDYNNVLSLVGHN